jgi:glycosyltransferase involved in cell wall biosynthesis
MKTKFSVVIPLYNKENYILETVNSVLNQIYSNFELIIVNDGSTDNSLKIVENLKDSRIKLIDKKNEGEGPARNCGIINATGDWIAFLDADDLWYNNHLHVHAQMIEKFTDIVLMSNKIEFSDNKNSKFKKNKYIQPKIINYFHDVVKKPGIVHSSSVAIKSEYIKKIGYFLNNKTGVDTEYWQRIHLMNFKMMTSNVPTVLYRTGTGGAMDENYKKLSKGNMAYKKIEDINLPVLSLINYCKANNIDITRDQKMVNFINHFIVSRIKTTVLFEDLVSFNKLINLLLHSNKFSIMLLRATFLIPQKIKIIIFKVINLMMNIKRRLPFKKQY